jgi:hypothetical protein
MTPSSTKQDRETREPVGRETGSAVSCQGCGGRATLEEAWDLLNCCSPSVLLTVHCLSCGVGPQPLYGRQERQPSLGTGNRPREGVNGQQERNAAQWAVRSMIG